MGDNVDCAGYEDHEHEDGPLHVVNTVNMVDDNRDVHIENMADDMVAAVNTYKMDVEVLELMEHFELVELVLVDIVDHSLGLVESSEGYVD